MKFKILDKIKQQLSRESATIDELRKMTELKNRAEVTVGNQQGVIQGQTDVIEESQASIEQLQDENRQLKLACEEAVNQNKQLIVAVANMMQFMYGCKQLTDGFVALANRLPDNCGLDSKLAHSILKSQQAAVEKHAGVMSKITQYCYAVPMNVVNPSGKLDRSLTVEDVRAAICRKFEVDTWDQFDDPGIVNFVPDQIEKIDHSGHYSLVILVGNVQGTIRLKVEPVVLTPQASQ